MSDEVHGHISLMVSASEANSLPGDRLAFQVRGRANIPKILYPSRCS